MARSFDDDKHITIKNDIHIGSKLNYNQILIKSYDFFKFH